MRKHPPIYYVVSFHFLAQDENKELVHQNWRKEFIKDDPLVARQNAFEEFKEYRRFLEINGKLEKDQYGNFQINSPSGIPREPEQIEKVDTEGFKSLIDRYSKYWSFSEDLDVLFVIADDELLDKTGEVDRTFAIHSLSSQSIPKQQLIDNLTFEMDLYRFLRLEDHLSPITVKHFGEDYAESGEIDEDADYTILPTPFSWTSKEQYENQKSKIDEEPNDFPSKSFLEKVIKDGETNTLEFKPSLAFNFKVDAPNYIPAYNNAKTICGFLNSKGGILLIGISDEGIAMGIEEDIKLLGSKDKIRLKVDDILASYFNNTIASLIRC